MNATSTLDVPHTKAAPWANPWTQLIIGIVCMAAVANMQYGWTLFVKPIDAKFHWGVEAIQVAFTSFVFFETWLVPVEGYLVDRFGPKWVVVGGGILVMIAWAMNSIADSLPMLYAAAVIGGIGTGAVYGTCVGNALKWFPGRRGIAAGFTAAGFGAGAALTVIPISNMISSEGYQHAFLFFGIVQGGIAFVLGWLLLVPPAHILAAKPKASTTSYSYTLREMLQSPVFYVLYLMFVLIAAGGLSMTASVKPMSADLKIDKIPVDLFGFTMAAGLFAVSLSRVFDGVGRPFFGWLSDRIGREYTMALAFLIGAGALFTLSQIGGSNPALFVLVTALYFGVYGEIFSLFPATCGDTFGSKHAAANAGMLYTAKGMGAFFVPVAAGIAKTHGYGTIFSMFVTFNVAAALLALLVLRPMRARHFAKTRELPTNG
jgi:MFS transporter, OFA family, oxalate/formate antiporter